jgi:hypothetical protein
MSCLSFQKGVAQQEHDCIPDEHYVQTLFSVSFVVTSIDLKVGTVIIITQIHNGWLIILIYILDQRT